MPSTLLWEALGFLLTKCVADPKASFEFVVLEHKKKSSGSFFLLALEFISELHEEVKKLHLKLH